MIRIFAPGRFVGWRVWFLAAFGWPLLLDLPLGLMFGRPRGLTGTALGILLLVLAARRMQRGRAGDARRGTVMIGVAAGLIAGLAAGITPVAAVLLGIGAWAGARLLTDDLVEAAPPPEPARPTVVPEALVEAQTRLAQVLLLAPGLPLADKLTATAAAMEALLRDVAARPDRIPEARRFLALHLDGLERVVHRLEAGAEPPAPLAPLLDEMIQAAEEWRNRLRAAETEALEIQVKVLADRLREGGR